MLFQILSIVSVEAELRKPQAMTGNHQHSYCDQGWAKQYLAPFANKLLDAEHGRAPSENHDEYHAKQSVGSNASCGIEQSAKEHTTTVFYILANVADGGNIRRQRARRNGCQQTQQECCQHRCRTVFKQCL